MSRRSASSKSKGKKVTKKTDESEGDLVDPGVWKQLVKRATLLQRGKIPLLLAVEAGNQSMCRELLSQSPQDQLKATTDNGDTAIHLASRKKDVDMCRILVDYGANVDYQNVS